VFAPGNVKEAYDQTRMAFELAYDYHIPAIVMYDQKLSGELRNVPESFFDREPTTGMNATLTEEELKDAAHHASGKFQRYQHDPEDGMSPRSLPGMKGGRYLASGNEHTPEGHISEDPANRIAQMDRRMRKLDSIRAKLDDREETHQTLHAPDGEDTTYGIMTYGSQQGTVEEATSRLVEDGHSVKALGVSDLMPFPEQEVTEFLESVDQCLVVEMNATAQFKGLVQRELGQYGPKMSSLLKYNGNPFEPDEIVEGFESAVNGDEYDNATARLQPAAGD
jgi:pyruvate ferredoxin oxidoreductase alpha subunit